MRVVVAVVAFLVSTGMEASPVSESPPSLIELTNDDIDVSLTSHPLVFIKFFTDECPFSRKIAPVWQEVAAVLHSSGKVRVAELECIRNKQTCERLKVGSFPTFKVFQHGAEAATFDTEKFHASSENFVAFARSFATDAGSTGALDVNKKKSFGKCFG